MTRQNKFKKLRRKNTQRKYLVYLKRTKTRDLQRNTLPFYYRGRLCQNPIFSCVNFKVRLCFLKKLNKKNNSLMYQHCTTAEGGCAYRRESPLLCTASQPFAGHPKYSTLFCIISLFFGWSNTFNLVCQPFAGHPTYLYIAQIHW